MADSSSGLGSLILSQGTLVRIQYPSLGYTPVPTINKVVIDHLASLSRGNYVVKPNQAN